MTVRGFELRPLPTLFALGFVALFVALGFWQLDRAEQKRVLKSRYSERQGGPALRLEAARVEAHALQYYPVVGRGHYAPRYQFLLANRVHNGRLGYHVLTPLLIDNGKIAVLVNRGWVPHDYANGRAPSVDTPTGTVAVSGTVVVPSRNVFAMEPPEPAPGEWQSVWYSLDIERYARQVPFAVQPFVVRLAPETAGGFVRQWRAPILNPAKNTSYAFQWFAMALAVVIIYLVTGFRRGRGSAE